MGIFGKEKSFTQKVFCKHDFIENEGLYRRSECKDCGKVVFTKVNTEKQVV